jgi:hypothetical protein
MEALMEHADLVAHVLSFVQREKNDLRPDPLSATRLVCRVLHGASPSSNKKTVCAVVDAIVQGQAARLSFEESYRAVYVECLRGKHFIMTRWIKRRFATTTGHLSRQQRERAAALIQDVCSYLVKVKLQSKRFDEMLLAAHAQARLFETRARTRPRPTLPCSRGEEFAS